MVACAGTSKGCFRPTEGVSGIHLNGDYFQLDWEGV